MGPGGEEIVHAAADEATAAVLIRLGQFEGRSRFTTWAYKFAILQTAVAVRRIAWRDREIAIEAVDELVKAARARGEDLTGPGGLLETITATVLQAAPGRGDDRAPGAREAPPHPGQ